MTSVKRNISGQCPICRKPATTDHRPFCSKHCADIDLGRWLGEVYTIPAVESDEDSDTMDRDEE